MMISVRTRKHVAVYALVITVLAVGATSAFVHIVTAHTIPRPAYRFAMLLAVGLPSVIAPPIAILALSLLRFVTLSLDKIESFVKFDAVTGVLARSYFMESVRQRLGEGGVFMLIDADHFKKVNDTFGHDVGDEALRTIGRVLNATAPHAAIVGRLGGEEFGMFIPSIEGSEAQGVAETICDRIRAEGWIVAKKPVRLTLSIGLALIEPGSTLTLIFKEADECLYRAKERGRDRYVFSRRADLDAVVLQKSA